MNSAARRRWRRSRHAGNPDGSWVLLSNSLVPQPASMSNWKPLAEAGDGFGLGVVGEDAGVDDGVIGAGEHMWFSALTLWRIGTPPM